jgi:membrane protease YdiL (CAAX protease family)
MSIYEDLFQFIKNPVVEKDPNRNFFHHLSVFLVLLLTCFMISFVLSIIIGMVYTSGLIENDYHAFDELKELPKYQIFLAAAVIAPILEETLFRAPLTWFTSPWKLPIKVNGESQEIRIKAFENPAVFRVAFYVLALTFGYIHLFNYQIDSQILAFSPLLVAPQIILGLIFGYIRVRLGFLWAVAMHACYNGILVSLFLVAKDVVPQ